MTSTNLSSRLGLDGTTYKDRSERRYRKLKRKSAARREENRRLILEIRQLRREFREFPLLFAKSVGQLRQAMHKEETNEYNPDE